MFSRQVVKRSLKSAFNFIKVDNVSHIHIGCTQPNFTLSPRRHFKNCRRNILNTGILVRFESTSSATTNQINSESTIGLGPIPEPPIPLSEITQSTVEVLGEPSLASLGLGGWLPPGWIQNGLEFLHVTCGLPWWGSVVCGTLIIRLLMFPLVIKGQQNMAALNNNLPRMQYIQMKVTEARQRGDKMDVAKYTAELMKFMTDNNVNPFKNMMVPLCQAPVFISAFMGLRSMTNLPVESLKTGGILWFVDLTVPDQFYILPLVTSATLFLTLKVGADGQASTNQLIAKYMTIIFPVVLFPFTLNFPELMLLYWTSSNFISLLQVAVLKIPKVRAYFKIPPIKRYDEEVLPIKDKGFLNNIKDAWTNVKVTSELQERERADRIAFLRAGREPIQKTYKYDPTKIKPTQNTAILQPKKRD